MKLMFISDIHGSVFYMEEALKAYEREAPDTLIILGDILYHGPRNPLPKGYDPKGVIELLNPLKEHIIAVRGNCDSEVDQMVLEFPMQGDYHIIDTEGVSFFLTHGHLYNNKPSSTINTSVFAQGHTHIPMIEKVDNIWHFNPGSITLPKENHKRTYAIYENKKITVKTLKGDCYLESLI